MANSEAGTIRNATQAFGGEYQVFLSFRGPDTRDGFTDFLYRDLRAGGVRVFRDDNELRFGEVIDENLLHAINNSMIYIPILSRSYASSKWCLRELKLMQDNVAKSEGQKRILPIFFHVDPDDVKLKTSLYREALMQHEKQFPHDVAAWRTALEEIGKVKGWNVRKEKGQSIIVDLVVKKVWEELKIKQRPGTEHLVGLDDRVKDLTKLLDVNQDDVRLIGIYGMGGIGKTTIAGVIFNKLQSHFGKYCSFLESVREMSTKDGIVQVQKRLLKDIVGSESIENFEDSEEGKRRIGAILSRKRVLVVLDDVHEEEHVKKLIGNNPLQSGSRIIVTTRKTTTLQDEVFKGKILRYEMVEMDDDLALQLFHQHALGGDSPSGYHRRLSSKIVSHVGGLPLAIKVIGSLLRGKDEEFWNETLVRLTVVTEKEILEKLRLSYDDLEEYQQQIFLDIACFFFNENKTDANYIWTYPSRGISGLMDRCLIKISDNYKLWMHDQLIDLGWHIVHEESPRDLEKQSRLRIVGKALEIIRTKERKDKVQALQIDGLDNSRQITNEEFERLQNLRLLKLRNGTFFGNFDKCRSKLRWISWQPPIQEFKAKNMYLEDLVVFKLGKNNFKDDSKAWDLIKRAQNLKVLSLTDCDRITTSPDFSLWSGLKRLTLKRCNKLKNIESSIGNLRLLIMLEIEWCPCLVNLPEEVGALVKLERFSLRGCHGLTELPGSLGNLTSLTELDLSVIGIGKLPSSIKGLVKLKRLFLIDTKIREIPNFIGMLKSLCILCLSKDGSCSPDGSYSREDYVWQLPNDISILKNLQELDLSGRDEMEGEIPIGIGELSSLKILNLEQTRICGIPSTISMLQCLQTLNLSDCNEIRGLPELPTSLTCLLLKSNSLCSLPNLSNLTNLFRLELSDGSSVTKRSNWIPGCDLSWIGSLSRLKRLELDLLNVPAPSELASLSDWKSLLWVI